MIARDPGHSGKKRYPRAAMYAAEARMPGSTHRTDLPTTTPEGDPR